jgi:hypothetical protein
LRVGVAVGRGGSADILGRRFLLNDAGHLFLARLELFGDVRIVAGHLLLAGLDLLDFHRLEQLHHSGDSAAAGGATSSGPV